jgi:hypothetical protein
MGLHPDFPTDPHVILDPNIRWYPGEELFTEDGYATLLPPLVYKVRQGVKVWRDRGYAGASDTTRALLYHWFKSEHLLPSTNGTRLRQWCEDATAKEVKRHFRPLFVRQEQWEKYRPKAFQQLRLAAVS